MVGLVLKFAILIVCIKHLLDLGRPLTTALIYAGIFLVLGLLGGVFSGWGDDGLLVVLLDFPLNVGLGYVFFWLLDRYRDQFVWFYGIIVLGTAVNLLFHVWLSGFVFPAQENVELAEQNPPAVETPDSPPHLWSHHRLLNVSAEVCAQRGLAALHALGFSSVVRNDTYVYGNSGANRAAVKCVHRADNTSFLYLAVAGPVKQTVENLRNQIAWSM